MKSFLFAFFLFCTFSNAQSLLKETTQINDSVDYYLEIASFNKEDKHSFNKAIVYTEKAIDYAKKQKLDDKLPECYLILGNIYYDLEKTDTAIENYIRSINLYKVQEPNSDLALAYYSLGKCYLEKNKVELSEVYFKKASEIYEKLNFKDAIQLINIQKGIIQKNKKNYNKAISIFSSIINSINNDAFINTKVEAYYQIGEIELINNRYDQAIENFDWALELNESNSKNVQLQKKILKQLSVTHKYKKDFSKSQAYLEEYVDIVDSLGNYYNHSLTENTFDKIQFDKQLKTIEQLDKDKKIQQRSLRFNKLISILSIALISILSLLSLSLYKNNKIRISTNKLLKEKNKELTIEKNKAERASKARAEFLATVSHELRTPLNAINGITYLLLNEKPKATQLNYLKSLEFSGKYLLTFINDILEINRLESDKVLVEKINFNLVELIDNIKISFNEFIEENNINFHLLVDKSFNPNIIGDPTKISQIIINLVNNAIKFSKNGDVWLSIHKKSESNNKITLSFEVKDNGIGIPKDKQATIFESFSQGSVEVNRTYGGTGLGLSIVKKIVEILGSEIHLDSDTNRGTTLTFDLTFKKGKEEKKDKEESISKEKLDSGKQKKILLVEDNKINQMITQKMLEQKGIPSHTIDNGEEAIEHLKENDYDLVLMDVHLPGINGTEATLEIRKFNPTIPIIALTAISLNENREMLLSYGMDEVIMKPFVPEEFYEILFRFLTKTEE
ncbi:MAG: hybrid sensor histidine kinase/response regulator [Flavobacterium sp.]|uniref:ATP-binding protein n=1 Tax=Flavobacterium sp. TaxID=239 RepID=UPI000C39A084|nr:ATP-binding protein [Flavobacterium sp.]MBF02621.1 hybrid sensor histidine kinase/response regulator [Flavobacterium sp.]|tara:strand:+ start:422 stop:2626 length:2205 start_codon:yes stop_codon:yes gene_type:complete